MNGLGDLAQVLMLLPMMLPRIDDVEPRTQYRDRTSACRQGRLSLAEGKSLLKFYDDGLEGYTYLEG